MPCTTLRELRDAFERFEPEAADLRIGGLPVWEMIRFPVFAKLCSESGMYGEAHPHVPRSLIGKLRNGVNALRSATTRSALRSRATDVLILGHERLQRNADGLYEDPYSEAYLRDTPRSSLFLERAYRGHHLSPRTPGTRAWYDAAHAQARRRRVTLATGDIAKLRELERAIEEETGVEAALVGLVRNTLGYREVMTPYFERVIRRTNPRVALVAVAYLRPAFIEACRNAGVPVIEIQHGSVTDYQMGYRYAQCSPTCCYPDYLWLWGPHWRDATAYPKKTVLREAGWPYFESFRHLAENVKERSCLFISQGTVGRRLADIALELRRRQPDLPIHFKLHPSEWETWQDHYADLPKAGIDVAGRGSGSLYDWLARSEYVVGGYSTALTEAVAIGCKVAVADVPGIEYLERLIDMGIVRQVKDGWDAFLQGQEEDDRTRSLGEEFFTPFDPKRIETLLNEAMTS